MKRTKKNVKRCNKKSIKNRNNQINKNKIEHIKPYYLVMDVGTFCDHKLFDSAILNLRETPITGYSGVNRLFDNAICGLRDTYKLVYITDKNHTCNDIDIKIPYKFPKEIIDTPGEIITPLMGGLIKTMRFFVKNIKLLKILIYSFITICDILRKTIYKYKPNGILLHSGLLGHALYINRFDIPTTLLHFCPGFIPNKQIPFPFNNILKDPNKLLFTNNRKEHVYNLKNGFDYQKSLMSMNIKMGFGLFKNYSYFKKFQNIMTFSPPLIPKLTYSNKISPIIKNVGFLQPNLPNTPLDTILSKWIKKSIKNKGKIIFISFGSYLHMLSKTNDILYIFLSQLHKYCELNNLFILLHDDKKILPKDLVTKIKKLTRILVYNNFVAYPTIVPKCKIVCFTGSVCLQNICWTNKCPMLYIPVLPEQFMWAKIYKYHTKQPYIDYINDKPTMIYNKIQQNFKWIDTKISEQFLNRIYKSIPNNTSKDIADCIIKYNINNINF